MSRVNNVMVSFGTLESEAKRMAEVNAAPSLHEQYFRENTSYEASESGWGGHKFPEKAVWAAAFNYVELDAVLEAVRAAQWDDPEEVQILWCGQDDDMWTIHTL